MYHTNPIIGRYADSTTEERAETAFFCRESVEYVSGSLGTAHVEIRLSTLDANRGGLVLELSINDQGGSWLPHAELTQDGVKLHVCGDAESESILEAMHIAIGKALELRRPSIEARRRGDRL